MNNVMLNPRDVERVSKIPRVRQTCKVYIVQSINQGKKADDAVSIVLP